MGPLLQQQLRRLGRLGGGFWLGTVLLWIGFSWFIRSWLTGAFLFALPAGSVLEIIVSSLGFVLRVELPMALLLQTYLWPRDEWERMQPQLRLTFLQPADVIRARVLPTFAVLAALNTLSAPFFYWDVATQRFGFDRALELVVGSLTAAGAWGEDLTFSLIATLCAARYLGNEAVPVSRALSLAVGGIVWRGAVIAMVGVGGYGIVMAGILFVQPAVGFFPSEETLFTVSYVLPVVVLLAIEALLIVLLWRRAVAELQARWGPSDQD